MALTNKYCLVAPLQKTQKNEPEEGSESGEEEIDEKPSTLKSQF
jgi:hypothetical protein